MRTLLLSALLALTIGATPILATVTAWPLVLKGQHGTATVYTPQVDSYANGHLEGRGTVMVQHSSNGDPVFGAISFTATVRVEHSSSVIQIDRVTVVDVKFPASATRGSISSFKRELSGLLTAAHISIGADMIEQAEKNAPYKTDPPTILVRSTPSMLVLIDGQPRWQNIMNSDMQQLENTTSFLFRGPDTNKIYLYAATKWYRARDLNGPWTVITSPSPMLQDIEQQMIDDMKKEGREVPKAPATIPHVVVSTTPAELLSFNGEPAFKLIPGTKIMGATTTEYFVFRDISAKVYFTVLSGRWFTASKLEGPWTYLASDALPADFKKIPAGSKYAPVLSHVSGTPAARTALLDAAVPTTAAIDRTTATCRVEYDGEPIFKPVDGTTLQYATNAVLSVLRRDDKYYCCDKGVWFEGTSATGPWVVSEQQPEQVEKISPSSPVYHTKFVYVYHSTPQVVYVGYTPGYLGSFVYGPTVVYGTGYYYQPWLGRQFVPCPFTYGFRMRYSPNTGWAASGYDRGHFYGGYWGSPVYPMVSFTFRPPHGDQGGQMVNINIRNTNIYTIDDTRSGLRPMATPLQR